MNMVLKQIKANQNALSGLCNKAQANNQREEEQEHNRNDTAIDKNLKDDATKEDDSKSVQDDNSMNEGQVPTVGNDTST